MSTRSRTLAALAVGVLTLALLPSGAWAATADDGDPAARLRAAGAGQAFGPPVTRTSFQGTSCGADDTGDTVDLDNDSAPVEEDRADIVEYCADYGPSSVTLSLSVVEPTDPGEDLNWQNSLLGWFIDTDDNGEGEYFGVVAPDEDGTIIGRVEDRSQTPADTACDGTYGYAEGTISLTFPADCIGAPDAISVNPGLIYDQRVTNTEGVAVFDTIFEEELEFSEPVTRGVLPDGLVRLAGPERIATSVAVSQQGWDDGSADTVVLARADLFPDALAGTPLAVANDAPILLTPSEMLAEQTSTEIQRLLGDGGTVVLLGGVAALTPAVEAAVVALGYDVVRHGGLNRFDTARIIATDGLDSPLTLLVADGGDFQDALLAGTAAATAADGEAAALLLTDGGAVPAETQAYLDSVEGEDVTTVGADAAPIPDATVIAGADDFETSVLVADAYFPEPAVVGIARDDVFADSLTGGALIGSPRAGPGPLLLVTTDALPQRINDYLTDNAATIATAVILGGVEAVSEAVATGVEEAITS